MKADNVSACFFFGMFSLNTRRTLANIDYSRSSVHGLRTHEYIHIVYM